MIGKDALDLSRSPELAAGVWMLLAGNSLAFKGRFDRIPESSQYRLRRVEKTFKGGEMNINQGIAIAAIVAAVSVSLFNWYMSPFEQCHRGQALMARPDQIAKVKANILLMASKGANDEEVREYVSGLGIVPVELRASSIQPQQEPPKELWDFPIVRVCQLIRPSGL
jgi:hypothetical protein